IVEYDRGVTRFVVRGFGDVACGLDERAHDMLLRDEFRIVGVVARGRGGACELGDIRPAAAALKESLRGEALAQGQDIYRVAILDELAHALEYVSMFLGIKRVWLNEVG